MMSTSRSAGALLRKREKYGHDSSKGGTPEGCESLCRTCTRGHIITGFRATEEEVFCRIFYIEREIRFPVRECTFYEDRRLASKEDMEKAAMASAKVQVFLTGQSVKKVIVVPGRLVNLVVG